MSKRNGCDLDRPSINKIAQGLIAVSDRVLLSIVNNDTLIWILKQLQKSRPVKVIDVYSLPTKSTILIPELSLKSKIHENTLSDIDQNTLTNMPKSLFAKKIFFEKLTGSDLKKMREQKSNPIFVEGIIVGKSTSRTRSKAGSSFLKITNMIFGSSPKPAMQSALQSSVQPT